MLSRVLIQLVSGTLILLMGLARSKITSGPLEGGGPLEVKAYTDLTLSGNDYVRISGQALVFGTERYPDPNFGECYVSPEVMLKLIRRIN